jgi:uncharacterized coiled-coil DUF342 family protein
LDLIRELVSALEMLEKGRTERAAMHELLLRLDHAIAATEEHVRSMSARLLQLDVRAKDVPARR